MGKIGSRRLATYAVDVLRKHQDGRNWGDGPFETRTWRYLGSGIARAAYLHKPTGVVYKVTHTTDVYDVSQAEQESALFEALRKRGSEVVPTTSVHRSRGHVVTVAPYLPTDTRRYNAGLASDPRIGEIKALIGDATRGNVGFDKDGKAWILDGGCPTTHADRLMEAKA